MSDFDFQNVQHLLNRLEEAISIGMSQKPIESKRERWIRLVSEIAVRKADVMTMSGMEALATDIIEATEKTPYDEEGK